MELVDLRITLKSNRFFLKLSVATLRLEAFNLEAPNWRHCQPDCVSNPKGGLT